MFCVFCDELDRLLEKKIEEEDGPDYRGNSVPERVLPMLIRHRKERILEKLLELTNWGRFE